MLLPFRERARTHATIRHAVVIRDMDHRPVRKVIQLGLLIAASFAMALMLLVRRGQPENDAPAQMAAQSLREERPVERSVAPSAAPSAAEEESQLTEAVVETSPREADASTPPDPPAPTRSFTSGEISQLVAANPEFRQTIDAMLHDPDPEVRRDAAELYNDFLETASPLTSP